MRRSFARFRRALVKPMMTGEAKITRSAATTLLYITGIESSNLQMPGVLNQQFQQLTQYLICISLSV